MVDLSSLSLNISIRGAHDTTKLRRASYVLEAGSRFKEEP